MCPTADNVNLTGDNGNYCIFNNANDVKKWCSSDPDCIGYVSNRDNHFQAIKKTQPMSNTSMFFHKKN